MRMRITERAFDALEPVVRALAMGWLAAAAAYGQAADPQNSSKVLSLSTFATFTTSSVQSGAIDLEHPRDGSGRVFVSTSEGRIHGLSSTGERLGVFLDLAASGAAPDFDRSLGSSTSGLSYFAFHPDYGRSGAPGEGKLYAIYKSVIPGERAPDYSGAALPTRPGDVRGQYVVAEWTVDRNDPDRIDPGSRREVIRFETSGPSDLVHSHGALGFNPFTRPGGRDHGLLYIPLGDMHNAGGVPNWQHVQDRDNPFGKILRIDPLASGGAPYSVPAGNPFADGGALLDDDGIVEEIYAWGFRNPQNMSFARGASGGVRLVVFDIGAEDYEEVNLVDKGDNHGWPRHDGPDDGFLGTGLNNPGRLEFPATVYDHRIPNAPGDPATSEQTAITGGYVVSDPGDPAFRNQVLFGDLARGAFFHADSGALVTADLADEQAPLFVMNVSVDGSPPGAFRNLIGSTRGDVRFGIDESDRLFIVSRQIDTVFLTDLVLAPLEGAGGTAPPPGGSGSGSPLFVFRPGLQGVLDLFGGQADPILTRILQTNASEPYLAGLLGSATQLGIGMPRIVGLLRSGDITAPPRLAFLNTLVGLGNPAAFDPTLGTIRDTPKFADLFEALPQSAQDALIALSNG